MSLALLRLYYKELGYDSATLYKYCLGRKIEQVKKTRPPIFRTAPFLLKMSLFILVSLAVCFSVGPILSSTLTYLKIRNLKASPYVSKYNYR